MTKRIAIATVGTQGDVQPYLALALTLQSRGLGVVLGAPEDFRELVETHGIAFASLGSHVQDLLMSREFEDAMSHGNIFKAPPLLMRGLKIIENATRLAWDMAQGADLLLLNMNTSFGVDIAEALRIPVVMAAPQPLTATGDHSVVLFGGTSAGRTINRLSHSLMGVQQLYFNLPRNRLRREVMGLGPRKSGRFFHDANGRPLTALYSYSAHVAPRPADWPEYTHITGYWRLADRSGWTPDPAFAKFLAEGPAPVYIGFGSMPFGAERNTEILREAMRLWGGRAVVARGWGGISPRELPPGVHAIDKAPHDKLFEHVSAVVHHGGAGTTAAGLHAGRPTFVVPQTVDQPFWGNRVLALGCGPRPVKLSKLNPQTFAAALTELTSEPRFAQNAAAVAARLAGEDGAAVAADLIEERLAAGR